jgi:hypothetical protein
MAALSAVPQLVAMGIPYARVARFKWREYLSIPDHLWLTEAQLEHIKPYFPLLRGVPRVNDRRVVSEIIHVIRNGQWCQADLVATTGAAAPRAGNFPDLPRDPHRDDLVVLPAQVVHSEAGAESRRGARLASRRLGPAAPA